MALGEGEGLLESHPRQPFKKVRELVGELVKSLVRCVYMRFPSALCLLTPALAALNTNCAELPLRNPPTHHLLFVPHKGKRSGGEAEEPSGALPAPLSHTHGPRRYRQGRGKITEKRKREGEIPLTTPYLSLKEQKKYVYNTVLMVEKKVVLHVAWEGPALGDVARKSLGGHTGPRQLETESPTPFPTPHLPPSGSALREAGVRRRGGLGAPPKRR